MELREFVKAAIVDITDAVTDAQEVSKLHVAPGYVEGSKITEPQFVSFEVSVTTSGEAGGAIRVLSAIDLKGGGATAQSSTIAFKVPVYFQAPTHQNPRLQEGQPGQDEAEGGSDSDPIFKKRVVAYAPNTD